ncbi:outer membrane lipoprotein-sorting protein [candidate division NPL-UPA2 bacterium Unc8]|uniref:Outer membrane lipoprotein-sorting protein n=1 Tax=candidate division NPL-UPA2 bacterium Unc8 TaxID=1980939 RepID=A0A399G0H1_UNCN2|nr:hypothetical protein [Bacillota bacterium]MBT9147372.1 hypothetical protein [Bacillota bacterium]RII01022.1 MAG: outer membrane lipoprotein-sorting protein [candidate division NPL-UPA2 bacterium Unc8]
MMKAKNLFIAVGIAGLIIGLSLAGNSEELTAREILIKSDDIVNAPADREIVAELIINEEGKRERKRIVRIWQKGEKGVLMFLYPDRLRRTAILTLPNNVRYVYLPIWREAERISLEEMEGDADFLGTGFTPADMEALIIHIDDYEPTLLGSEKLQGLVHYILKLKIKESIETDYPVLRVWIRKDEFYPVMIEQYDREGKLQRVAKMDEWEKTDGYWLPRVSAISDLRREREIEIRITEVTFDQGLGNELFTPRKLKRLHKLR